MAIDAGRTVAAIAAGAGVVGAAAGWAARGVSFVTGYGRLQAELRGVRDQMLEFKAEFLAHRTGQARQFQRVEDQITTIARELNQLIGIYKARNP